MTKNIIFLRPRWHDNHILAENPRFDWIMHYGYWFLQPAYDYAVSKYPAEAITTLAGDACTPDAVTDLLREKKGLVFHLSHGAGNALSVNEMKIGLSCYPCTNLWSCILPEFENVDLLKDDVFYTGACLSAQNVGPEAIKKGCNAYMGYFFPFMYAIGIREDAWYHEEVFQDILSSGAIALLEGKTPEAARRVVIDRMYHWLDEYGDHILLVYCISFDLAGFRLFEKEIPEAPIYLSKLMMTILIVAIIGIIGTFTRVMLRR